MKEKQKDWERFERAVDVALKTPAKHKKSSRKSKKNKAKSQIR